MTPRVVALACSLLLGFGAVERNVCSAHIVNRSMHHNPAYNDSHPITKVVEPSGRGQQPQEELSQLIRKKIANRERFFGIEVSARSTSVLDYNEFKAQPLFTSVVWAGEIYANIEPISNSPAVKLAGVLRRSTIVTPHLTCYNMTERKLVEFPLDDFRNILVLRGDTVHEDQQFSYAVDLVREIRRRRPDGLTIAVGGYPEVHPTALSKDADLNHLKEKVDAGADMIVTQLSFSADLIMNFIKNCRRIGITVPIIPGIYIPKSYQSLSQMCRITKVCPPSDQMSEYSRLKDDEVAFQRFAINNARKTVRKLLESNLNIFGVQFFTMNYFENVQELVQEFFI